MALQIGSNVGFVTVAPTADPAGTDIVIDGASIVCKDTSPAGSVRITEIGWYRGSGTNTANFEVALYSEASGVADARLYVDNTNSSNVAGWIRVTGLDWSINPNTAYWLAVQMDAHSGSSYIDSATAGGYGIDRMTSQTTLNNPYGGGAVSDSDGMYAVYALVEVSAVDNLTATDIYTGNPVLGAPTIAEDLQIPVIDNFNRSDGPLGSNWTLIVDNGDYIDISSNKITMPSNNYAGYYWNQDNFGNDQLVKISSITFNGSSGSYGLFFRFDSSSGNGYYAEINGPDGNNTVDIYPITNFIQGSILTQITDVDLNAGDIFAIKIVGWVITIYLDRGNGFVEVANYTETSHLYSTGSRMGLLLYSQGGGIEADDFGGKDFVAHLTATDITTGNPVLDAPTCGVPSTVLDDFNRANENLVASSNWNGSGNAAIVSNELVCASNDNIWYWQDEFGVDQVVSFKVINPTGSEFDLLLKSQNASSWSSGVIEVYINASSYPYECEIYTYSSGNDWVKRGSTIDFGRDITNGDIISARCDADGLVSVYLNDELKGSVDCSVETFTTGTGYIGFWINGTNAKIDDFGGGDYTEGTSDNLTATNIYTGNPVLGAPTIGQTHVLSSTNIYTANPVLGAPTIGQTHVLTSTNINTQNPVLGAPTIGQTHVLNSTNIYTQNPVLDAPSIGQTHVLTSLNIATEASELGNPVIGQIHQLVSTEIVTGSPVLDAPTLYSGLVHDLTATDITTGNPVLDTPTIGQTHVLSSNDIYTQNPVLGAPSIGQTHLLTPTDIYTQNPVLGAPTLSEIHALNANDIYTEQPVLGGPTIGQTHVLTSTYIYTDNPVLGTPTLSEIPADELTATDITTGNPVLDQPSISQTHVLTSTHIYTDNPVLDSPTIGQKHVLTSTNINTQNPVLGVPTIGQIHVLTSTHIYTDNPIISSPNIGQKHLLTSTNISTQNPVLDAPTLSEIHALNSTNIYTGNPVLDTPYIQQTHILLAEDIFTGSVILGTPFLFSTEIETPEIRTYIIEREDRNYLIKKEDRNYIIYNESREID